MGGQDPWGRWQSGRESQSSQGRRSWRFTSSEAMTLDSAFLGFDPGGESGLVAWDAVPGLTPTGVAVCPNFNEIRILNTAVCLVGNGAAEQLLAKHPLCGRCCAGHAGT